jgi:hypothetical protein
MANRLHPPPILRRLFLRIVHVPLDAHIRGVLSIWSQGAVRPAEQRQQGEVPARWPEVRCSEAVEWWRWRFGAGAGAFVDNGRREDGSRLDAFGRVDLLDRDVGGAAGAVRRGLEGQDGGGEVEVAGCICGALLGMGCWQGQRRESRELDDEVRWCGHCERASGNIR